MKKRLSLLAALVFSSMAHADIVGTWQFVSSNDPEDIQALNGSFEFRADGTYVNTTPRNPFCSGGSGVWSNDTGTSFQMRETAVTCDGVTSAPDYLVTQTIGYIRQGASLTLSGEGMQYNYQAGSVAASAARSDCLFDWAESHYPALFGSIGAQSQTAGEYYYRQYAGNVYLGTSSRDGNVYYLAGGQLNGAGAAADWYAQAGCQ